jgi:hypothetical protein
VDALLVAAGGLLVLTAMWDIAVTVLDPGAPGPLSFRLSRLVWAGLRGVARTAGTRRILRGAGPTTMAAGVVLWLSLLWVGFALVFVAYAEDIRERPAVGAGSAGFVDALYLSGVSLTTVGFGDVFPATDTLRLLTVLEGGAGLATITAAITYLLSVYLVLGRIRHSSLRLSDLGLADPRAAAQWVERAGVGEVARVHEEVSQTHEDLRRFPNLYYFHAATPAESVAGLLRAATVVTLVLRFGLDPSRLPFAEPYGRALEATLARVIEEYELRFLRRHERPDALDEASARPRLEVLRDAVPEELRRRGDDVPADFLAFLPHAESFLNELARIELFDEERLLDDGLDAEPVLPAGTRPAAIGARRGPGA